MNKTVLITGASGNLGIEVVRKFASDGYRVAAVMARGQKMPSGLGSSVVEFEADLSSEKEGNDVVERAISEFESIDAALLLAGGFAMGNIKDSNIDAIRHMVSVNFDTAYTVARPLFNHMVERKSGRIVFVGARPALRAELGKNMMGYTLSKSLLFKLADIMNAEGSASNVITSVIVPSTIDTAANRAAMPGQDFSKWVSPASIAAAAAFLCSAEASSVREPVLKLYGDS